MEKSVGKKQTQPVSMFVRLAAMMVAFAFYCMCPVSAHSEDRLVVKNSSGVSTFKVDHTGFVFSADLYAVEGQNPGFWLDETGSGNKGAYFVLDEKWMQVQRRAQNFGAYEASPVFVNVGAPHSALVVAETGYVGFGKWAPSYPVHLASGAYCSSGGVWTNASSREYKKDIQDLTSEEAMDALKGLSPVKFSYRANPDEQHVGFIAENVPDLVASRDRKGMSAMDVVAVLTRVVQEQQETIAELSRKVAQLERRDK